MTDSLELPAPPALAAPSVEAPIVSTSKGFKWMWVLIAFVVIVVGYCIWKKYFSGTESSTTATNGNKIVTVGRVGCGHSKNMENEINANPGTTVYVDIKDVPSNAWYTDAAANLKGHPGTIAEIDGKIQVISGSMKIPALKLAIDNLSK